MNSSIIAAATLVVAFFGSQDPCPGCNVVWEDSVSATCQLVVTPPAQRLSGECESVPNGPLACNPFGCEIVGTLTIHNDTGPAGPTITFSKVGEDGYYVLEPSDTLTKSFEAGSKTPCGNITHYKDFVSTGTPTPAAGGVIKIGCTACPET